MPMGGARGKDIRFIFFTVHFYPVNDEVSPPTFPTTSCCLQLDSSTIIFSGAEHMCSSTLLGVAKHFTELNKFIC